MRNRLKVALALSLLTITPFPVTALTLSDNVTRTESFGNCRSAGVYSNANISSAWASIIGDDFSAVAGGAYFEEGVIRSGVLAAITWEDIATCLGGDLQVKDVALVQDGANGTFQTDNLIGFGFKLARTVGEFKANQFYTYTIGSGTLEEPDDFDTTPPTLTLRLNDPETKPSGQFVVRIDQSEIVTGLTKEDLTVVNGTIDIFGGVQGTMAAYITPTELGKPVTIDIAAGVAEDLAGNKNTAATQLVVETQSPDTTAPTVSITGPAEAVTEDFTATFTFSEDVTGFTADDVVVTNGTKGAFAGSGKVYTLVVTPELGKTVTVAVAANVAEDGAGNGNEAAETFEVLAGSVATEFKANKADITNILEVVAEIRTSC